MRSAAAIFVCLFAAGCGYYIPRESPAMPASSEEVRAEWARLRDEPSELSRPVIIIDGWVPRGASAIKPELKRLAGAGAFEEISYWPGSSLEHVADLVVKRIERQWPSNDAIWTTEVDVVGFSAGGVIARLAALAPQPGYNDRKRLRIARLFTISSPHAGTVGISRTFAPDRLARQLRPNSTTLSFLDQEQAGASYEMYCYGQLNDQVVSVAHTAPAGTTPIWSYGRVFASHSQSARNRRILLDIALRLRGEAPMSVEGAAGPR